MIKINNILPNKIMPLAFTSKPAEQSGNVDTAKEKEYKEVVLSEYLESIGIINSASVKKVQRKPSPAPENYKNDLRTLIQNNQSVMLAMSPRTFTAKDLNGDDIIMLTEGEKPGTLLSAIDRLDELKNDGYNTIHILPIHPPGTKNAMGTAGSVYSPAKFLEEDGTLAIESILIEQDDPRSPSEQFKAFINECHKRGIRVMLDLPSCASVTWYENEKPLMAFGLNEEDRTPQGWADIRMFEPWVDESKRTLNPKLLELHKQYVDACIDLGIDGIRADVARAKPVEFWDILIPYSREKDPEFAWLAESYTYECASPQVNMPYDRPEDSLRAGFDEYYGQYHIFHQWGTATEFNDYVKHNLAMSQRLDVGKTCIGSFMTHDDEAAMNHGGEIYCNLTTILQSTIPMCNPYFVDGFQTGDYYNYKYSNKYSKESLTDSFKMKHHDYKFEIFNFARQPGGDCPDIQRVIQETLKMRKENLDLFADKNSSFIELDKYGDKKDQIITYARHNNGRTAIVIANKNPNRHISGTVKVPGLSATQELNNMAPVYGEERSEFQVAKGEIRVNLAPAGAYVFEINTPNIEYDRKGHVFKQKTHN
ncbi:hypothetical protein IJD34_02430 [bacterium]|nr:hypothetical protein [bacterium]